jgi:hypothetical protein
MATVYTFEKIGPDMEQAMTNPPSPATRRIPLKSCKYSPEAIHISKLRSLQKEAMTAFDVEQIEAYQKDIATFHNEKFTTAFRELKYQFGDSVRSRLNRHEIRVQELKAKERSEITEFRRQIDTEFGHLRTRHEQQLTSLQAAVAARRISESQRTVSEADELNRQAMYAASVLDYEYARYLQGLAERESRAELERRFDRLEQELSTQTARMLAHFETEIVDLGRRLELGIDQIHTVAAAKRDAESNTRDTKFVGELIQVAKDLAAIAPRGTELAPYLHEIENVLIAIIEAAGLPLPPRLRKNLRAGVPKEK